MWQPCLGGEMQIQGCEESSRSSRSKMQDVIDSHFTKSNNLNPITACLLNLTAFDHKDYFLQGNPPL